MTIRYLLHDAGHYLCATAPPVLVLGLLTAVRAVEPALMSEGVLGMAWRAATVASTTWLLIAAAVAADRPRRDRSAHDRLEQLRDFGAQPNRALVRIQTTRWDSTAGQHAVVLNVATGVLHRVWLPETQVPVGAFAVLERTNGGVRMIDRMDARGIEAAHRQERRHQLHAAEAHLKQYVEHRAYSGDAAALMEEVEEYLRMR